MGQQNAQHLNAAALENDRSMRRRHEAVYLCRRYTPFTLRRHMTDLVGVVRQRGVVPYRQI